ncbi:LOW QUALITY PROTEIN: uncharacterized protein Dere_GG26860, partial [Drosophila erecta]
MTDNLEFVTSPLGISQALRLLFFAVAPESAKKAMQFILVACFGCNNLRKLAKVFYGHHHRPTLCPRLQSSDEGAVALRSGLLSGNVEMFTFSSVCFSNTLYHCTMSCLWGLFN